MDRAHVASLDASLHLLSEGVHLLPCLRDGDDAVLLVAVNSRGRAVCNTPEWVPTITQAAQRADELRAELHRAQAVAPPEAKRARARALQLVG